LLAGGAIQPRRFFGDDEMRQRQRDMTNVGYVTTDPQDIGKTS
jgi:hypothetical protein